MNLVDWSQMAATMRSEGWFQDPTAMLWRGPDGRTLTDDQACQLWQRWRP